MLDYQVMVKDYSSGLIVEKLIYNVNMEKIQL